MQVTLVQGRGIDTTAVSVFVAPERQRHVALLQINL
jgi:hypothetical protein